MNKVKPSDQWLRNNCFDGDPMTFDGFRIQTVRKIDEADMPERWEVVTMDNIHLLGRGEILFGVYGTRSGICEHVADFQTERQALDFLGHLGVCNHGFDPAAALGVALSLTEAAKTVKGNVSEAYAGADQFMRECARVGEFFERWANANVNFDELEDVWPYMLEDKFAEAAGKVGFDPLNLADFKDATHCLLVARELKLTIRDR